MTEFFIIVMIVVAVLYFIVKGNDPLSEETINQHLMEEFGETKEERREGIKSHFARDTGKISMLLDVKKPIRCRIFLERNLMTVDPTEKFALEVAYHLFNEGYLDDHNFFLTRLGLFHADGQGLDIEYKEYRGKKIKCGGPSTEGMNDLVTHYHGMTLTKSITHALNNLEGAHEKHPDNPVFTELFDKYAGGKNLGGGQFNLKESAKPDV